MKIVKTNILDSNLIENDQATKILLFDNLVEHFAPLFYEETRKKQEHISSNMAEIKKLKNTIFENRNNLLKLKLDLNAESLKNKILQEINNLSSVKGKLGIVVKSIVSSLENQSISEMEKRLALLQKISEKT